MDKALLSACYSASGLSHIGLHVPVQSPKITQLSISKVLRCQRKQIGTEQALLKGCIQRMHLRMQRM